MLTAQHHLSGHAWNKKKYQVLLGDFRICCCARAMVENYILTEKQCGPPKLNTKLHSSRFAKTKHQTSIPAIHLSIIARAPQNQPFNQSSRFHNAFPYPHPFFSSSPHQLLQSHRVHLALPSCSPFPLRFHHPLSS